MRSISTGAVRELAWTGLQPHQVHPEPVLRSVSAQDATGFIRTLAVNPLVDTNDTGPLKVVVAEYKRKHPEHFLAAHPYVHNIRGI